MPLLLLALSVMAVVAMAGAGAASKTPPMVGPGGVPVVMKPGEIWSVAGMIDHDMTDAAWQSFQSNLTDIMTSIGARAGKLDYMGRMFTLQVQPTTSSVSLQVPMVSPPFTITKAEKLRDVTEISGYGRRAPMRLRRFA